MSQNKPHLAGKVAWVTGSSRGIGRSILSHLAKAGANVIIHGSSPDSPRVFNEGESLQAAAQDLAHLAHSPQVHNQQTLEIDEMLLEALEDQFWRAVDDHQTPN